jgi:hypothetical protein
MPVGLMFRGVQSRRTAVSRRHGSPGRHRTETPQASPGRRSALGELQGASGRVRALCASHERFVATGPSAAPYPWEQDSRSGPRSSGALYAEHERVPSAACRRRTPVDHGRCSRCVRARTGSGRAPNSARSDRSSVFDPQMTHNSGAGSIFTPILRPDTTKPLSWDYSAQGLLFLRSG